MIVYILLAGCGILELIMGNHTAGAVFVLALMVAAKGTSALP